MPGLNVTILKILSPKKTDTWTQITANYSEEIVISLAFNTNAQKMAQNGRKWP
jgi:hypothetical protein